MINHQDIFKKIEKYLFIFIKVSNPMNPMVKSESLYESLYHIIYNYLNDNEKLNFGIVCKSFNKYITKNLNIQIAKKKIKVIFENLKSQKNIYISDRYKQLFEHTPDQILEKLAIGYDYVVIRHCGECFSTIKVYYLGGEQILHLDVEHCANDINKYDFFICSCVYHGYGLIDKYLSNRDEYYVNGKYIGTNLLMMENNKYVIKDKQFTILFKTINDIFISKKTYAKIFNMIKITDGKEYVEFLKEKEFVFNDSLYNFLETYN